MSLKIQTLLINCLSVQQQDQLLTDLYNLSKKNLQHITQEYLKQRLNKYSTITLVHSKESSALLAFCFSQVYPLRILKMITLPVLHVGLTVVSKSFQGRKVLVLIFCSLYQFLIQNKRIKKSIYWTGACLSAKCSTPVSFLKIKKSAFHLNWPGISGEDRLSWFSRSPIPRMFSRKLSQLLSKQTSHDFILRDINKKTEFQLIEEEYVFQSQKEKMIVRFFQKHIMPFHELMIVVWFHPVFVWILSKKLVNKNSAAWNNKRGEFKKKQRGRLFST